MNVPVNFVAALVTVNCGEVPLPMSKETLPSGLVFKPSPDQVTSSNRTSGGAPEGANSVIVTVVPNGNWTPDDAANLLAAVSFIVTEPASRPGAGSHAATTVNVTPAISGEERS